MAINKQKLFIEVKNLAGVPDETWVKDSYSGGVTHKLVDFWLKREIDMIAGNYEFPSLQIQRDYTEDDDDNTIFLNSAGDAIKWDEDWLRVAGGKVGDVPLAFQYLSDIKLNEWEDSGSRVLAYESHDHETGDQLIQFLADKSASVIELYVYMYPSDVRQFPRDFYDLFMMKLAVRALRIQQAGNLEGIYAEFIREVPKKEMELKGKYARRGEIGLVKQTPSVFANMTRSDLTGSYSRRVF